MADLKGLGFDTPDLTRRDLAHNWHPCSQMKDYESFPPLHVVKAEGSWITLANGQKLFDAISSWWCKSLGHGHPKLREALTRQIQEFEHVIYANTTHEGIVELSERLAGLTSGLKKVFYGGDGTTAVEIALKMSHHAQQLKGQGQRTQTAALEMGYHGESALALGVSDLGLYGEPYEHLASQAIILKGLPLRTGESDPLWQDASAEWPAIEAQLAPHANTLACIILEPVVQGAGGMRIYSPDLLRRLRQWSKTHGVHLIFDEIMTGFGRTGKELAANHAGVEPDFLCISKGLTSGWLPMSATLCENSTFELFYDNYESKKAFMHSNTYTGNALGVSVALAALRVYEEEGIYKRMGEFQEHMMTRLQQLASGNGRLGNLRGVGGMVAADISPDPERPQARLGYEVFQEAIRRGALLRPLGNTIYWMPPLNTPFSELDQLAELTSKALKVLELP